MSAGPPAAPTRRAQVVRWLLVASYCGLIFYLSSTTGRDLPKFAFMRYDKVLHALEYGGLGALTCRALMSLGVARWRAVLLAVAFVVVYGAGDEFHQSFVPGRNGNDPGDVAADTVGGVLGALAFARLQPRLPGVLR